MHELHEWIRQRYEAWERSAIEEGEARGRREAEEVLRGVLIGLLTQRFGSVPESVLTRVHEADIPTLARWASRVLAAASLDDVLA